MSWRALAAGGLGLAAAAIVGRAAWWRAQDEPIEGRVAVVAGGSRGLGLALGQELVAAGCRVSLWARNADELEAAAAALGEGVHVAVCDVGDEQQVAAAAGSVAEALGPVDLLFNVAGEIDVGPAQAMQPADFERALRIMFWGMLQPTLALLPEMRSRGWGRIVNITSVGGKLAVPHLLPYSAAKFAAVGLSEGLTSELRPAGVRVTTVVPGLMRTGSHLAARYHGDPGAEYDWFALAASAPLLSVNVGRAAARIVAAARRGEPVVLVGATARLATVTEGLLPGVVVDALAGVARVLPDGGGATARGAGVAPQRRSAAGRIATRRGELPAQRLNQTDGE